MTNAGVIGQDIIMLYDKILIDFKNMSVRMIKVFQGEFSEVYTNDNSIYQQYEALRKKRYLCITILWRGARVVEEARLESVYMPKVYHGFESRSLRKKKLQRPKGRHR